MGTGGDAFRQERQDLVVWAVLSVVGLGLTWLAVRGGAQLGTRSAPFLGSYRFGLDFGSVLAPASWPWSCCRRRARSWFDRAPFRTVLGVGWLGAFAWALALALADGAAGLTRALRSPDNYLADVPHVGGDVVEFLRDFTADGDRVLVGRPRGHPPGPVLLLWALQRMGFTEALSLGILLTALGALVTPLVLSAVRGVCGETPARRYAPVLMLAPYAVWLAVSVEAIVAVLGAAMVAMGVRASAHTRRGCARRRLGPGQRRHARCRGLVLVRGGVARACRWCACTSPAAGRSSTWPPGWAHYFPCSPLSSRDLPGSTGC